MESMSNKVRNKEIDFARGIAIILVVYEHVALPLGSVIHFFHMPLFFFISGGVYRKYNFSKLFIKKMKGLYFQFLKYECIFLILHNFFVKLNIYPKDLYISDFDDWIQKIIHVLLFDNTEVLLVPMWFITVLFLTSIIYWFIDYILKDCVYLKLLVSFGLFLISHLFTINHWLFIEKSCFNKNVINVTFAAFFFFFLGKFFYQNFEEKIKKQIEELKYKYIIMSFFILICFLVNVFCKSVFGLTGTMRLNDYNFYMLFLVCSICGILMICLFSYCCVKTISNKIVDFICYLGNKTFFIMAIHLLISKVAVVFYIIVEANQDWQILSEINLYDIGYIYRILAFCIGIWFPVGIAYVFDNLVKKIENKKRG